MAKKIALVLCIFLVGTFITGCGDSLKFWKKKKEIEVSHQKLPPFKTLFERTVEMYNTKQYKDAINSFLFLRENYPQETAYQSRITLYLADSHYHQKEYPEAIANYREFIKLYPTSPDVPYAYFQIGMCNYKQKRTYDRDATFVRKAIKSFKKVLNIAPPGVLVNESIRMIALCERELALHDLFIADFYLRTHHYKSAVLRYKDVLQSFPNFKIHDRAHLGLAKAYLKLKERNKAFRHLSYVAKNYPNSRYGKEAWKLLQKDFKVSSLEQLPDVTFPTTTVASAQPSNAAKKSASTSKTQPPSTKATAEKVAFSTSKPAIKKQAKTAAHPSTTPPEKVAQKPAPEPKPHVYFPKITKVQEKPTTYFPPVKKAEKPAPSKVAQVKNIEKAQTEKPATKPAPQAVKTPPAPPTTKQPAAKIATHPAATMASSVTSTSPKVQSTARPESQPTKKAPKPAPKKHVAPSHPVKPAPAPTPKVKVAQETSQKAPTSPKPHPAATPQHSAVKKPEASHPTVKKMVKTDTLPPKKKQASPSGLVGALDTRKPIHITADHVESQQGKNSVRFYGRVVAKQKNVTLKCDDLTAFYTPGGKAIDKIIAHGNVVITQLNKKVTCGKAIFYNAARKIELEGSPVAWDGNNRVSGNKMVLLLDKNEIQIIGSEKKPSELVIYPNKLPASGERPGQAK